MKKFTYILAVDPGGSKCDALLVAADGTLLRHCRLRDWATGGRHPEIMRRAIDQALAGFDPAPLRIVAQGGRFWIKYLSVKWHKFASVRSATEGLSGLSTARLSHGVVVIAGTGARVTLRTHTGKESYLDALGPVLGDDGSGYYIGREAMRAVARETQLKHPATRLRRRIFRACGCRGLWELVHFSLQPRDRSLIASLTKIVNEEASAGDPLARRLLREGATAMANTVRDLVQQHGIAGKSFPLIATGSVAAHSDLYWRELRRHVRRIAPRCKPVRVVLPPVAGLAAIGLADAAATAKLFTTLKKELKK